MKTRLRKNNAAMMFVEVMFSLILLFVHLATPQFHYPHFPSFYAFQQYPILNGYFANGGGFYHSFLSRPTKYNLPNSYVPRSTVYPTSNIVKFSDIVHENSPVSGYVDFVEANNSGVTGRVFVEQRYPYRTVTIRGRIYGLKKGLHGFHIHQNGELGNNCKDAGPHFNPMKKNHGAPNSLERHVGDLGNILTNSDAQPTEVVIHDKIISLDPNSPANILDLAIVIHGGEDDIGKGGDPGSLKTGNAGSRLACGIIKAQQ